MDIENALVEPPGQKSLTSAAIGTFLAPLNRLALPSIQTSLNQPPWETGLGTGRPKADSWRKNLLPEERTITESRL